VNQIPIVLLALTALCAGCSESEPSVKPTNTDAQWPATPQRSGPIAFARSRGDEWQLFLISPNGARLRRVSRLTLRDWWVGWSPDGTRLAVSRPPSPGRWGQDLYVMSSTGRGLRRLTRRPGIESSPVWSPAGDRIAFGWSIGRDIGEVHVVHADGTHPRRAWTGTNTGPTGGEYGRAWSPDGRHLAFTAYSLDEGGFDVWVMDAEAGTSRRITSDPGLQGAAAWSPAGEITFVSQETGPHRTELWLIDAEGKKRRRLAETRGHWEGVAWSPGGTRLALTEFLESDQSHITILRTDDPSRHFAVSGRSAVWSPNGRQLVFTRGGDLWIMNANGGRQRRITETRATEIAVSWLPQRPRRR
jgi:Tol biopolymer transport system component